MLVVKKETSVFKHDSKRLNDKKPILIGIRCRWFTTTGELQEATFSTKDLIKILNNNKDIKICQNCIVFEIPT